MKNELVPPEKPTAPVSHHTVIELMTPYLRQSLPPAQMRAIRDHIAGCDRCAQLVREHQTLEDALYGLAPAHRQELPPAAAQRIQQNVYRRMRRALIFQRSRDLLRMGTAVATTAAMLILIFFLGQGWFAFLAAPEPTAVAGELSNPPVGTSMPPAVAPTVAPVPTAVPALPAPPPTDPAQPTDRPVQPYWQHLRSVTPGMEPVALAQTIVQTALQRDSDRLQELMAAQGTMRDPIAKHWTHFGSRCQYTLSSAADLRYEERTIPLEFLTTIYLYAGDKWVGEIKMRRIHGEWFATYTIPPALNQCLRDSFVNRDRLPGVPAP